MQYETEVVDRGPLTAREAEVMGLACSAIARGMIRMLCLVVSVSAVLQDDAAPVCRLRVARPSFSSRRFD